MTMRWVDRLVAELHKSCKVFETYTFTQVIEGDHQYDIDGMKKRFVAKCMKTNKFKTGTEAENVFYDTVKQHCLEDVVEKEWSDNDDEDSF
jgi:hypothetical protein